MARYNTRKSIEKRIASLGGTSSMKRESWKLADKFNNILIKEMIKTGGICSLNHYEPSVKRFFSRNKSISKRYKQKCLKN